MIVPNLNVVKVRNTARAAHCKFKLGRFWADLLVSALLLDNDPCCLGVRSGLRFVNASKASKGVRSNKREAELLSTK